MKDFVLLFRNAGEPMNTLSPQQMQTLMTDWQNWMGSMAAQDKLSNSGYRLSTEGNTLKANNVVTDGPYAEIKEILTGVTIIKADTLEEANQLAKGCPILKVGGSVEVRGVIVMNMDYNK
ncbi:transcription initiation protein [Mucilaginibacter sp. PPCGB 2223]|uniref:YciI family protein n=1 Tax=Mucilaginibacter sp. PPCGB 2223 TaxID=1886027 RepID=UPI000826EE6F|nr:YciI family protein [Mucilaginibacter sp. PPCGB 2223]OCX54778.1 transcription initiation protein [Mucilaginibacter sp. PPCGB 2223]